MCGRYKKPDDPNDWSELKIRRLDWRNSVAEYTDPYYPGLIILSFTDGIVAIIADQWAYVPPYSDSRWLKFSVVWRTAFPAPRYVNSMGGYCEWVPEAGARKKTGPGTYSAMTTPISTVPVFVALVSDALSERPGKDLRSLPWILRHNHVLANRLRFGPNYRADA